MFLLGNQRAQRQRRVRARILKKSVAAYAMPFARTAHATHIGRRDENQDCVAQIAVGHDTLLCMLADGMGTYGKYLSHFAIHMVAHEYTRYRAAYSDSRWLLQQIVTYLHSSLSAWRRGLAHLQEPGGTTLEALVIQPGHVILSHVGDSRVFLLRGTNLHLLTHDHSIPGALVAQGILTPEQASHHMYRSYLLRYLGSGQEPAADYLHFATQAHDRLLVCSDGLWSHLLMSDIVQHLYRTDPARAVSSLLGLVLERGAHDNVSLIIIETYAGAI